MAAAYLKEEGAAGVGNGLETAGLFEDVWFCFALINKEPKMSSFFLGWPIAGVGADADVEEAP